MISAIAPLALSGVGALIVAIEERRLNDPAAHEGLRALQELHHAIGELLEAASRNTAIERAFSSFAKHRDRFYASFKTATNMLVVSPVLTLGVVDLLSLLSGVSVDSTLLSTVYAAMVGSDVARKLVKGQASQT